MNINPAFKAYGKLLYASDTAVTDKRETAAENAEKIAKETSASEKLAAKRRQDYENAQLQLEHMREQQESSDKENRLCDYGKLLKIAARIMNGDIVPLSDKKKLAEAMPDLYRQAELLKRTDNKTPEKYKSEFKKEKENPAFGQEQLSDTLPLNDAAEIPGDATE